MIIKALENDDCKPALNWATHNRLVFELHRFEFIKLLKKSIAIWQSLIHDQTALVINMSGCAGIGLANS